MCVFITELMIICQHRIKKPPLFSVNTLLCDAVLQSTRTVKALQYNCFRRSVTNATVAGFLQSINKLLHDLAVAVKGKIQLFKNSYLHTPRFSFLLQNITEMPQTLLAEKLTFIKFVSVKLNRKNNIRHI